MLTAVRKQGNSLTLTVPKDFSVPVGVRTEPELREDGIFYRFLAPTDPFDLDTEILRDLVDQGFTGHQLVDEFEVRKAQVPLALKNLLAETLKGDPVSRNEFENSVA